MTHAPCLTVQYPLHWNWKLRPGSDEVGGPITIGTFTKANTRTKKIAVQTMAGMIVRHVLLLALQEFTNNVGFEKRRNRFFPILPADLSEMLAAVKKHKTREHILEALFNPFCLGVAPLDIGIEELPANVPLPAAITRKLAEASQMIHLPPLDGTITLDGHTLRALLVFQIHPYVVEPDRHSAYFPLIVGLQIAPDETDAEKLFPLLDEPWADDKNWSQSDRDTIWDAFLKALTELADRYGPKPPPAMEEAIVSINAQLKIVGPAGENEKRKQAIDRMLQRISKEGEIIHWQSDTAMAVAQAPRLKWFKLSDEGFERKIFDLVNLARDYQNVQWLTHTNAADRGRDISAYRVTTDSLTGPRTMRVILQSRHKKCVGVAEVSQLKDQMSLWEPPRVDELIIATSGRFSTDAVQWIEKHNESHGSPRIIMWPDSHLERLIAQRPKLSHDLL